MQEQQRIRFFSRLRAPFRMLLPSSYLCPHLAHSCLLGGGDSHFFLYIGGGSPGPHAGRAIESHCLPIIARSGGGVGEQLEVKTEPGAPCGWGIHLVADGARTTKDLLGTARSSTYVNVVHASTVAVINACLRISRDLAKMLISQI